MTPPFCANVIPERSQHHAGNWKLTTLLWSREREIRELLVLYLSPLGFIWSCRYPLYCHHWFIGYTSTLYLVFKDGCKKTAFTNSKISLTFCGKFLPKCLLNDKSMSGRTFSWKPDLGIRVPALSWMMLLAVRDNIRKNVTL